MNADFHLELEEMCRDSLLRVHRGESTMADALFLAGQLGLNADFLTPTKPRPVPQWDGTCNPF